MIGSPIEPKPSDNPGAPRRPWIAFALAAATTAASLATIGAFGLRQWLAPLTPLILMATAGLIAVALVSLATLWPADRRTPDGRAAIRTALALALVCAAAGAALSAAWASPGVRVLAVHHAARSDDRAMLLHAMSDPEATVVDQACEALVAIGPGGARPHLFARLADDPVLANRCSGDAEDNHEATSLRRELASHWHHELRADEFHAPTRACELAGRLGALPGAGFDQASTLFACTVEAKTRGLRDCCTRALHARPGGVATLVDELQDVEGREADVLRYAFGADTLDDDERRRAVLLGLEHDMFRGFAIAAGCEAIRAGDDQAPRNVSDVVSGMQLASSTIECPHRREVGRRAETWQTICERVEVDGQDPRALCTAITSTLHGEALAEARERVEAARALNVAVLGAEAAGGSGDGASGAGPLEHGLADIGFGPARGTSRANHRSGATFDAIQQLQGLVVASGGAGRANTDGGGAASQIVDARRMLEVLMGHENSSEMRNLIDVLDLYSTMLDQNTRSDR